MIKNVYCCHDLHCRKSRFKIQHNSPHSQNTRTMCNTSRLNFSSSLSDNVIETANVSVQVVVSLTTALSILLNIPVIIIMISGKCLGKTITSVHILSLSFSDLLTPISALVVFQTFHARTVSYDDCWARVCLLSFALAVSIIHMCFICLDRRWVIIRKVPMSLKQARGRFWIIVLLSWSTSALITIVPFVIHKHHYMYELTHCALNQIFPYEYRYILQFWSVLLLLAEVLIIGSCISLISFLRRSRKVVHNTVGRSSVNIVHRSGGMRSSPQPGIAGCSERHGGCVRSSEMSYSGRSECIGAEPRHSIAARQAWSEHFNSSNAQAVAPKFSKPQTSLPLSQNTHRPVKFGKECDELPLSVQYLHTRRLSKIRVVRRQQRPRMAKHQTRAIQTLTMLAVSLFITMTPMLVFAIFMQGWVQDFVLNRQVRHIISYIAVLNSALNPVIYAFRVPEIRTSLRAWKDKVICR